MTTEEPVPAPEGVAMGEGRRSRHLSPVVLLALGALAGALAIGIYMGISARTTADAKVKQATQHALVVLAEERRRCALWPRSRREVE